MVAWLGGQKLKACQHQVCFDLSLDGPRHSGYSFFFAKISEKLSGYHHLVGDASQLHEEQGSKVAVCQQINVSFYLSERLYLRKNVSALEFELNDKN